MISFTCKDVASPLQVVYEAAPTSASFTNTNPLALPSSLLENFRRHPSSLLSFPWGGGAPPGPFSSVFVGRGEDFRRGFVGRVFRRIFDAHQIVFCSQLHFDVASEAYHRVFVDVTAPSPCSTTKERSWTSTCPGNGATTCERRPRDGDAGEDGADDGRMQQLLEQQLDHGQGSCQRADQRGTPGRERRVHGTTDHLRTVRIRSLQGTCNRARVQASDGWISRTWKRDTDRGERAVLVDVANVQGEADSALDTLWQKNKAELNQ